MRVEFLEWDDTPHYSWDARVERVFTDGLLLSMRAGNRFCHHAKGFEIALEHDAEVLFRRGQWWSGGPDFVPGTRRVLEYYLNVNTPPEFGSGRVRCVDLQIDLKVRPDHHAEEFDRDEFERAAAHYGYPAWLRRRVEQTLHELRATLEAGEPPFLERQMGGADGWLSREP